MRRAPGRAICLLLAAAAFLAAPSVGADDVALGDAAWASRAEGESGGRPRPDRIFAAVGFYERALKAAPQDLEGRWKLLRALHFAGDFAVQGEEVREVFGRAREVSTAGLALLEDRLGTAEPLEELGPEALRPRLDAAGVRTRDVARLYFWSAINWGAWSRTVGLLSAVRRGVANRVHRYTLMTLALEPDYDEGGAFRLLGRLHAELPRVPFVSGWVDRGQAVPLIERAYALAPANPGNRLLLGITLLDLAPDRSDEALALLDQVQQLTPRPTMRIEDLAIREQARERLRAERAAAT
ncbi:MAG: hypothetical protein MJE66_02950 [Proteobacteria bacterium]|nr:hypothetical protein [Pseudomonadota bacterium]